MYNTQINLKSFLAYAIRWDIHKGCLADPPVSVWKIRLWTTLDKQERGSNIFILVGRPFLNQERVLH